MSSNKTVILGAGVTGLAAGIKTGFPIYEANSYPGGICYSYEESGFRFEFGGGHWIFGQDLKTLDFIENLTPLDHYTKNAAVYFSKDNSFVPYPIQNYLPKTLPQNVTPFGAKTFKDQLLHDFGPKLCQFFFFPFNKSYTAGLFDKIAPQDSYKNPTKKTKSYNNTFVYPTNGLSDLINLMAQKCEIHFNKKVKEIDLKSKLIYFNDQTISEYKQMISTLPLNRMIELTKLDIKTVPAPYTSTLVINIGAKKGKKCPDYHWLYIPKSKSGFYRLGFYSNVNPFFLPVGKNDLVSLYVEIAYKGGQKPTTKEISTKVSQVIRELRNWEFVNEVLVADPTFIDIAYTWNFPDSTWKEDALKALENQGIHQLGRYGRWHFQGILESIKEGLNSNVY